MKNYIAVAVLPLLLAACQTTGNYEERLAALDGRDAKIFSKMVELDRKYCVISHTRGSVPESTTPPRETRHYGLLNHNVSDNNWYSVGVLDGRLDDTIYMNVSSGKFLCGSKSMQKNYPGAYGDQYKPV